MDPAAQLRKANGTELHTAPLDNGVSASKTATATAGAKFEERTSDLGQDAHSSGAVIATPVNSSGGNIVTQRWAPFLRQQAGTLDGASLFQANTAAGGIPRVANSNDASVRRMW